MNDDLFMVENGFIPDSSPKNVVVGYVKSVIMKNGSCTVFIPDEEIETGELKVVQSRILSMPSEGDMVVCVMTGEDYEVGYIVGRAYTDEGFMLDRSEYNKYVYVDAEKVFIGGAKDLTSDNGIVRKKDLQKALDDIRAEMNSFIAEYNGHFHPASTGTTSPTTTPSSPIAYIPADASEDVVTI